MSFKKGFLELTKSELNNLDFVIEGNIIQMNENKAPFLVVYKNIENIILTDIPMFLYEVEIMLEADNSMFIKEAPHRRVLKARIIKELDVSYIFGEYGKDILKYLESMKSLTYESILSFQARTQTGMAEFYQEVLKNYRESLEGVSHHLATPNKCFDLITFIVFSLGKINGDLIESNNGFVLPTEYEEALSVMRHDLLKLCHII